MTNRTIGTAHRVTTSVAARAFANGQTVAVSANGYAEFPVTALTQVHSNRSTSWHALTTDVHMWRNRYPNQRYYLVDYADAGAGTTEVSL